MKYRRLEAAIRHVVDSIEESPSDLAVEKIYNIVSCSSGPNYHDMYDKCKHLIDRVDYTKTYKPEYQQDLISFLIEYKQYKLVEIMLKKYHEKGNNILTKRDNENKSQICIYMIDAISEPDYDFVEMLLKYVVDFNEPENIGEPSYLSLADGSGDIIELLRTHMNN